MRLTWLAERLCACLLGVALGIGSACSNNNTGGGDMPPPPADMTAVQDLTTGARIVTGNGSFKYPIGLFWDAASSYWYVSNIVSAPAFPWPKGTGFISRISADFATVDGMWVKGLNMPGGLRTNNGKLYVSDLDSVAVIDVATGMMSAKAVVMGTGTLTVLNGLTIDTAGVVYMTDTFGNNIYRYNPADGTSGLFTFEAKFNYPTGLYFDGSNLVVTASGLPTNAMNYGGVWKVDLATGMTHQQLGSFQGKLGGIDKDATGYLIADLLKAVVTRVDPQSGAPTPVRDFMALDKLQSTSGLSYNSQTHTLGVVDSLGSQVAFYKLP